MVILLQEFRFKMADPQSHRFASIYEEARSLAEKITGLNSERRYYTVVDQKKCKSVSDTITVESLLTYGLYAWYGEGLESR